MSSKTQKKIQEILTERFHPIDLNVLDESARHKGHAGAASGGGHYAVEIVSEEFKNLTLLDQHRRVKEALKDLMGKEIHALRLKTAPSVD